MSGCFDSCTLINSNGQLNDGDFFQALAKVLPISDHCLISCSRAGNTLSPYHHGSPFIHKLNEAFNGNLFILLGNFDFRVVASDTYVLIPNETFGKVIIDAYIKNYKFFDERNIAENLYR